MDGISLQFQGVRNHQLLIALLAGVMLSLVVYGVVQLVRRKVHDGLLCLAGAAGPLALSPFLIVSGGLRHATGRRRRGNAALLGGILAGAGALLAGVFITVADDTAAAFWMSALALEVAVAVAVFYAAVYAYLGTQRMAVLMFLRCLAILALMLLLFKPALSVAPDIEQSKPYLPVLVDRSASMSTADEGTVRNRYDEAVQMLGSQQSAMERTFRPVWVHFAEGAQMVDSLDSLTTLEATGEGTEGTDLAGAIRSAVQKHSRENLAGLVLVSDGIHNASANLLDAVVEAGVPIYSLGVGSTSRNAPGQRNVRITSVSAPLEVVKNNVTTLTARLKISALPNVSTDVQLFEEGAAQPIVTESVWTDSPDETLTVDLKWTPRDRGGPTTGAAGDLQAPRAEVRKLRIVAPTNPAESVTADNEQEIHVLVTEPRVRVLYVEGAIRPEYKYLRRLLDSDPNVQFMGLVRVRENVFLCQGSIGGRQLNALPSTDEEFRMFDVILLGDLDRTFVSRDQLERLRRFANDGGGLLMIGGHNSFGPGGYGGTAVEEAMPVTMGSRAQPQEKTPFIPQLTAQGEAHPVLEGISGYFFGPGGRKPFDDLQALPELTGCVTVVGPKPGAAVLALHPTRVNEAGPLVVLAAQNFGAGRTAAFTADTTWRWFMELKGLGAQSPYDQFWAQMVRWLANVETKSRDTAPAVVLRLDSGYVQVGQTVQLTSRVQDEQGRASDSATVTCTITPAGEAPGEPETVSLAPGRGSGVFDATWRAMNEGEYVVKATAIDSTGTTLGSDELELTVAPHSAELERLARDETTLRMIADRSGGRYGDVYALPEVVRQIGERHRDRTLGSVQAETFSLHNFTILFLLFIALLTGEWLLRRSWQLQ